MLRVDYSITYGVIRVKNLAGKICNVKIHPANALCAFIYHYKDEKGKKFAQLVNFLSNTQHIKNIMKDHKNLMGEDVVGVKLNVYYKEARTLVEPMCKSGYKVTCYYKEPKKK